MWISLWSEGTPPSHVLEMVKFNPPGMGVVVSIVRLDL